MNKVILMGRLVRDPETRYGQSGKGFTTYTLAVNRSFKREGEPDADFFRCTVFGKGSEFAEKYLKKGQMIAVVGELRNSEYTDKNGDKRTSTGIIVSEQFFAEKKQEKQEEFVPVDPQPGEDLPF